MPEEHKSRDIQNFYGGAGLADGVGEVRCKSERCLNWGGNLE